MKTIEHFVGGKSFSGDSKRLSKVFNPATGGTVTDILDQQFYYKHIVGSKIVEMEIKKRDLKK